MHHGARTAAALGHVGTRIFVGLFGRWAVRNGLPSQNTHEPHRSEPTSLQRDARDDARAAAPAATAPDAVLGCAVGFSVLGTDCHRGAVFGWRFPEPTFE